MKVSASVYMTLKVEVHVGDWEAAQPFEQLHKQAEREARQALENVLSGKPSRSVRMLGESAVMHVITREQP